MMLVGCARAIASMTATRKLSVWLHELSHVAIASMLGYECTGIDLNSASPSVSIAGPPTRMHSDFIRHGGWIASLLFAIAVVVAMYYEGICVNEMYFVVVALFLTAAEAVHSDLLSFNRPLGRFFCGNFGVLLLQQASAHRVDAFLRRMLKVTMMRGAQSAGFVTYVRRRPGTDECRGVRHRVVNGKRTDLSDKLFHHARKATRASAIQAPQIFQGHTRFATSSIADFSGTHPHQWTPKSSQYFWRDDVDTSAVGAAGRRVIRRETRTVEGYITHNGDLDFFSIHGTVYALGDVQAVSQGPHMPPRGLWRAHLLCTRRPCGRAIA